jgi:hypothetical protein
MNDLADGKIKPPEIQTFPLSRLGAVRTSAAAYSISHWLSPPRALPSMCGERARIKRMQQIIRKRLHPIA